MRSMAAKIERRFFIILFSRGCGGDTTKTPVTRPKKKVPCGTFSRVFPAEAGRNYLAALTAAVPETSVPETMVGFSSESRSGSKGKGSEDCEGLHGCDPIICLFYRAMRVADGWILWPPDEIEKGYAHFGGKGCWGRVSIP
jgi:hypothetical protein